MTHRLRAIGFSTSDHEAHADLHRALDPAGIVVAPDQAEVRLSAGPVIHFRRDNTPSRYTLGFGLHDLAGAATRLEDDLEIPWRCTTPGVVDLADCDGNRVYLVGLTDDPGDGFPQRDQKLIAVTMFMTDVPTSARWWRALGLSVGDQATLVGSVPPDADHADVADVFFDGPILQLAPAGTGPTTVAHMVIGGVDLDTAAESLAAIGWDHAREPGALTTMTPDGCGVRLTAPVVRAAE